MGAKSLLPKSCYSVLCDLPRIFPGCRSLVCYTVIAMARKAARKDGGE
jgi:hypothetical protein